MFATEGQSDWVTITVIIVAAIGGVATQVITFLTMWIKLKYGADKATEAVTKAAEVEKKIDHNTQITTEAKVAAQAAEHQTNGTMTQYKEQMGLHDARIVALEKGMAAMEAKMDAKMETLSESQKSTRHEMRNLFQTVTNKLDLIAVTKPPDRENK